MDKAARLWRSCAAAPFFACRFCFVLLTFLILQNVVSNASADDSTPGRMTLAEAVRTALACNPEIAVQQTAEAQAKGNLEAASGEFDLAADLSLKAGRTRAPSVYMDASTQEEALNVALQDVAQYQVSLIQKTRWGLVLQPKALVSRTVNHTPGEVENTASQVGFNITLPLVRGLGGGAATAQERASRIQVRAAEAALRDRVAAEALATVNAYWSCKAAELSLGIYREAESNALRTVTVIKAMISGSLQTKANLEQANANYDGAVASRMMAEKNFSQAVLSLGLAMGLNEAAISSAPLAADPFPEIPEAFNDDPATLDLLLKEALLQRQDLRASMLNEEASAILLAGARDNLLPQVDLNIFGGYAGVDSGEGYSRYATALTRNAQGLNVQGSLSFNWPIQNRAARGRYNTQAALLDQYRIRREQKAAQVVSDVLFDARALALGLAALRKSEASTQAYRYAVRNQETLFELGSGSLLDVINTQNSLANAQLQELNARLSCLKALAQFHRDLGRMVEASDSGGLVVDTAALRNPPAPRPMPPDDAQQQVRVSTPPIMKEPTQ